MSMVSNRKVLFLHGWAQNGFVMKSRTKKVIKRLTEAGYECIFLHAPHILPMTSTVIIDGEEVQISNGDRENARAWFMYSEEDYSDASMALNEVPMIYHGLDASIEHLRKFLETEVDDECVIFGFSQGATFCHVLSVLAHHAKQRDNTDPVIAPFAKIQKTILVSGFAHMHQNPLAESLEDTTNNIIQVQSLHVYGEGDTSVPRHFSEDLVKCFVGAEVYVHEKGHFIPHNKALIDTILCFLDC